MSAAAATHVTLSGVHPLQLVIVGHVDHGKSTFVGRLLHETGALPESKVQQIRAVSERRGQRMEWAFLLDAFQAERDQGITIDVSRIPFKTHKRQYVIIDAPGHKEFLKNMVTGAADAEAAFLMIDAKEGLQEQSRRHAYLLSLMGTHQVAVLVTKMDLIDFDHQKFAEIERDIRAYLRELGLTPRAVVPIAAQGEDAANIVRRASNMLWYTGPTVIELLDQLEPRPQNDQLPFRMPVQDIYRFDERRIIAGRVETGRVAVGDTVIFSPSGKSAKVRSVEAWNTDRLPQSGSAGQCVGFTLDQQIFVERGEVASHEQDAPILSNVFRGNIFWFSHKPLRVGHTLKLKLATAEHMVTVQSVDEVIDTENLGGTGRQEVLRSEVAKVTLRARGLMALDEAVRSPLTGRFVLVDDFRIVGGGTISMEGYPNQRDLITVRSTNITASETQVDRDARWKRNGHKGAVLWMTGLSGAGKSTIAREAEKVLFLKGYNVYVLDGDNVRGGLNANLGFSPEDRAENIRRVGEVAALFADAGIICLASFISPYASDRERARKAAGDAYHEVFVRADLEVCEERDPKGLYKRARAGEIADFTGISAPYEAPQAPELDINTAQLTIDEGVALLVNYVESHIRFT
ncbi:MAG: adenylyl-sulfate kinase [Alphaproteobacteria bacterium]|nr:adenylyl-sulfate kinase [Alphaproteobacteria bacterium]MCB9929307.1 adenylyl-sulfate kinase [Alphaproteobacteria bacterium]